MRVDRSLVFPSAEYVRNIINKHAVRQGQSRMPVVIDCSNVFTADYTAARAFRAMARDFRKRGQVIFFTNMKRNVESTFMGLEGDEIIVFRSYDELRPVLEGVPPFR